MNLYLDNAATTCLAPEVLAVMLPYLQDNYGNPSSIHALGRKSRAAIEQSRKSIAQVLNVATSEIFFTSGGTEANNTILLGAVRDLGIRHIITSPLEHHCVLHTVEKLAHNYPVSIHYVKILPNGHIDLEDLEAQLHALADAPKLVSLMHSNNEIGNLLPLDQVGKLCRQYGALFHTDTVQSLGYYEIDVQKLGIDFLSGSSHKFHGPKGVGFAYINGKNRINPFISGGSQERNMRAGTENLYGIVGMGKAITMAYSQLAADERHIKSIKEYLITQLQQLPHVQFNGDYAGASHYKILNVGFLPPLDTELLLFNLDIAGICASGGSACSSGVETGSHVLHALPNLPKATNIRFSFSRYNELSEIDVLIDNLKNILKLSNHMYQPTV